jgi:mannosyl-3-phosphoglycerate phosphatase
MGKSVTSGTSDPSYLLIFTDLDGTLLDAETYGWKEALPALGQCRRLGVPIILVSSKTRAEMEPLHRKLRLSAPFISENGGGIFFPSGSIVEPPAKAAFDNGLWKWSLGVSYERLIKGLREIRDELGWNLKGFSDMSIEEISWLTGLDEDTCRLAAMREFDEPFVATEGQAFDWDLLSEAAAKRGLTVTMGGRFYHLQGKNDKGQAMESVISWYKQDHRDVITVALGDSPNDFSMLECADFPVLIRSQKAFPEIEQRIARLRVSREMGPKGWNTAVLDFLQHKEAQRNAWQASRRN